MQYAMQTGQAELAGYGQASRMGGELQQSPTRSISH